MNGIFPNGFFFFFFSLITFFIIYFHDQTVLNSKRLSYKIETERDIFELKKPSEKLLHNVTQVSRNNENYSSYSCGPMNTEFT